MQLLSGPPVTSVVQVPAALAQERHGVVQLSAQHVESWQLALAHSEPTLHGCPLFFLQEPEASQLLAPLQLSSVWLVTSVVQVPAAFAQERHGVVQASAQQVPSTQLPLAHSLPALQPWPSFFLQLAEASQVLLPVQLSGSSALATGLHAPDALAQERHAVEHAF